jgi:hypothetical protein
MAQLICLANSWKYDERCIAGIDMDTGQWVRPVCPLYPHDGRVPIDIRLVEGEEVELLDILDLPLASNGPDFGFESENRTILPGDWQRVGRAKPTDLLPYCCTDGFILHTHGRSVGVPYLQSLPIAKRHTLQLVYAVEMRFGSKPRWNGSHKWSGSLRTGQGAKLQDASITDPVFVERLNAGDYPQNPCLVLVSLSMPFNPARGDNSGEAPCWKLIAGVIELTTADLILVEMRRLGWSIDQGRDYLQAHYGKGSRRQLSQTQLQEFLDHLRGLNCPYPVPTPASRSGSRSDNGAVNGCNRSGNIFVDREPVN